jgi:hypothetical protein
LNRERYVQGGSRKVVTARLATREDLPVLLPLIEAAIAELQKGFLDEGADRGEPRHPGHRHPVPRLAFQRTLDLVIGLMS